MKELTDKQYVDIWRAAWRAFNSGYVKGEEVAGRAAYEAVRPLVLAEALAEPTEEMFRIAQIVASTDGTLYGLSVAGSVYALRWKEVPTEEKTYNEYGGVETVYRREYFWQLLATVQP
jgi:hypothetical protein